MAQEGAHIYRNANGVMGGVCCGIAEYFDLDVALVRLLAIILTVLSAGAFALIYLAVWLILPPKPTQASTLDVDPAAFRSEVYEQVVNGAACQPCTVCPSIPPVPPAAASSYYQSTPQVAYVGPARQAGAARSAQQSKQHAPRSYTTGLAIGILLIAVGLVFFTSFMGFFTVDANAWITQAGPFLLIAVGLFIMGRGAKSNILILCAGLALIVFIVSGAYFGLQEGPTELGASLPFSPDSIMEQR